MVQGGPSSLDTWQEAKTSGRSKNSRQRSTRLPAACRWEMEWGLKQTRTTWRGRTGLNASNG